jgi:hypothetical protein
MQKTMQANSWLNNGYAINQEFCLVKVFISAIVD